MNTVNYVLYDKAGRIIQTGASPASDARLHQDGPLGYLEGEASLDSDYVQANTITPRPPSHAELAGNTLIGLPVPCIIQINSSRYNCNEPVAVLNFPYPGTYRIRIEAFPYLDANFTLEQT